LYGTNYFVKNLWHNLVHNERQLITDKNFRYFRGTARDYSDFMADNLAGVLLAMSYGCEIHADSTRDAAESSPYKVGLIHLQRRNRCNQVFAERAKIRARVAGREPRHEAEWRYRRAIAIYTSGWLLASGRAPATISAEFGRKIEGADGRKDLGIVVEVNGVYVWTSIPRIEMPDEGSSREERQAFRRHLQKIAIAVDHEYVNALRADPRRRAYARDALSQQLLCLRIDPPPELVGN
jgi:hypothetical protein